MRNSIFSRAGLLALAFLVGIVSCGDDPGGAVGVAGSGGTSGSGGTGGTVAQNQDPIISDFTVANCAYREATVSAVVQDLDGEIASVEIDWGDGTQELVELSGNECHATHVYDQFMAEALYVRMEVTDNEGAEADDLNSVLIPKPIDRCVGFKGLLDACMHLPDRALVFEVYVKMLGLEYEVFGLDMTRDDRDTWDFPPINLPLLLLQCGEPNGLFDPWIGTYLAASYDVEADTLEFNYGCTALVGSNKESHIHTFENATGVELDPACE